MMKKNQLYKLMDLIEEIKKVDGLLKLHQTFDQPDFMATQYQARKDKLISFLIDDLLSPELRSPRSYFTIRLILEKFYPDLNKEAGQGAFNIDDFDALESALKVA